jgi:hypothetical protein
LLAAAEVNKINILRREEKSTVSKNVEAIPVTGLGGI